MRNVKYKVCVMLHKKSGKVLDATCECRASIMGRCSHVAGVLYALENYIELFGHTPVSCTSKLCNWNQGRKEKKSTEVMKRQYSTTRNVGKIYAFNPDSADTQPSTRENLNNSLLKACQAYPNTTMWEFLLEFKYENYSVSDERLELLKINTFDLQQSLCFNLSSPGEVPGTSNQNLCTKWKDIRKLLITASVCTQFVNLDLTDTLKIYTLLKSHMWFPKYFKSVYTQHGIDNEPFARSAYISATGNDVKETGLWVNPRYPGLGASPDGIIFDKNTKTYGILEIKCPYVLKDLHPNEVEKLSLQQQHGCCVFLSNNQLTIKKSHKYYSQIQMQMAICDMKWCDFVIWTHKGIHIERLEFDPIFWSDIASKLLNVHFSYMCPEYFEQRIPRKLLPVRLPMLGMNDNFINNNN